VQVVIATVMIKYIELKSGYSDDGPAWIANVNLSKSGSTIYFNGMALKRIGGTGIQGNYQDLVSGLEYWVSGVKKNGLNRHPCGAGKIAVEQRVIPELLEILRTNELDLKLFEPSSNLKETTGSQFYQQENEKL